MFWHVVYEADNAATLYNGDPDNENFQTTMRVGGSQEQSTVINNVATSVLYDYSFTVSDGAGNTYNIAVIDADLDNDGIVDLNSAEQGYYLVFMDDAPPPNTSLTVTGLFDNSANIPHTTLGATPICFSADTLIETDRGAVLAGELEAGDLVRTLDNGMRVIRWVGARDIGSQSLEKNPNFVPIRIRADALGPGCPERDLLVSPQHRLLVTSKVAGRMFGSEQVLVAAKHLVGRAGIDIAEDVARVRYVHFLCDSHEIVYANGAPSESLFTGPQALKSIEPAARAEIFALFPELVDLDHDRGDAVGARPFVSGRRAKTLFKRHQKNDLPVQAFA